MPTARFILPGDPETKTGGYLYDKHIVEGLRGMGWNVDVRALGAGFPSPDERELAHAQAVLADIPSGDLVVLDGLALGGMPEIVQAEANRLHLVALIHHPLAAETGLNEIDQARLFQQERTALEAVVRVIVTSPATARALQRDYGVSPARLGVVPPGTDPAPLARGSGSPAVNLLCVASLTPRKGHLLLLDALAPLNDLAWRLVCVGSLTRDAELAGKIQARARSLGMEDRIEFAGEREPGELADFYDRAEVFVLPSYLEGYGMVLAEALARGLPIVSTTAGAIPDTVPADASLLVPPGDATSLRDALKRAITDPALRARLAAGARAARATLPGWDIARARFAAELERAGS